LSQTVCPFFDPQGDLVAIAARIPPHDITSVSSPRRSFSGANQELAALNEIGHELSKLVEPTEIAKLIHSMIGKVVDIEALVALYDEQRQGDLVSRLYR